MAVNLMGPVCSSWGVPNRGTSLRSFINAQGQEGFASVSSANKMISRTLATSIFLCVCVCMHRTCIMVLEYSTKCRSGNIGDDGYAHHMGIGTPILFAHPEAPSL